MITLLKLKESHKALKTVPIEQYLNSSSPVDPDDLKVIRKIKESKFTIFLTYWPRTGKTYAMKAYPHTEEGISLYYKNESRFSSLNHPNIIPMIKTIDRKGYPSDGKISYVSCILLEYAKCDFSKIISQTKLFADEKLIRTFFHQLVDGIEYLHSQGVYHIDIKPDNVLLGQDYKLKITDFDHAYMKKDGELKKKGTPGFRPPEIKDQTCRDPAKADIYSLGITLFYFKMGYTPYVEGTNYCGFDLQELVMSNSDTFWDVQAMVDTETKKLKDEFKDLFNGMVSKLPEDRMSLQEIKSSRWFNEPVYTEKELVCLIKKKTGDFL